MSSPRTPESGKRQFTQTELRQEIIKQEIEELSKANTENTTYDDDYTRAKQIRDLEEELRQLQQDSMDAGVESDKLGGSQETRPSDQGSNTPPDMDPTSISPSEQLKRVYEHLERIQKLPRADDEKEEAVRRSIKGQLESDAKQWERRIQSQKASETQSAEKLTPEKADALEIDLHYERQDSALRALRNDWVVFFLERVGLLRKYKKLGPMELPLALKGEEELMTSMETQLANMHATKLRWKHTERKFTFDAFRNKSLAYNILLWRKKRQFFFASWPARRRLLFIRPVKAMLSMVSRQLKNL